MPRPTATKSSSGGKSSPSPTSVSPLGTDATFSTSTDPVPCDFCKTCSEKIIATVDQWLALARENTSIFSISKAAAIELACSQALSITEALVDTWWGHLVSIHLVEDTRGTKDEEMDDPSPWFPGHSQN